MIGGLFAGTEESPGEVELYQGRSYKSLPRHGLARRDGAATRLARPLFPGHGRGAREARARRHRRAACRTRAPRAIVHQLVGGLRAAMGYAGCATSTRCARAPKFVRITGAGAREPRARRHDHQGTAELPGPGMTNPLGARREQDAHAERILVLDFGGQYTQLIARRMREVGVYCEILPWDVRDDDDRGVRAEGHHSVGRPGVGARSTARRRSPTRCSTPACRCSASATACRRWRRSSAASCAPADHREYGYAEVEPRRQRRRCSTRSSAAACLKVWMSHGDRVERLPPGFAPIGNRRTAPFAAMADDRAHVSTACSSIPEVTHTAARHRDHSPLRARHLRLRAGLGRREHHRRARSSDSRDRSASDHVLLGLSGGVDSSVVAALLHEAIGDQLTCVFVDNGLLRLNEGDQVMDVFAKHLGVNVIRVDAETAFLAGLQALPTPSRSARSSAGSSSKSSTRRRRRSRTCAGSRRARSIPTSSSRPARRPARRT